MGLIAQSEGDEQRRITVRVHEDPIINAVYNGQTTLTEEVEKFYGLSSMLVRGETREPYVVFTLDKEVSSKKSETPNDLVDILIRFQKPELYRSILTYDSVRSDYEILHGAFQMAVVPSITVLGRLAFVGGALAAVIFGLDGEYVAAAGSGIAAGTGLYAASKAEGHVPKDSTGGYLEFLRLHSAAREADRFIQQSYQNHLDIGTTANVRS